MKIGPSGIALVKEFEGLRLSAYQDSVGVWTCGYGSTTGVGPDTVWTQDEADAALLNDLKTAEACVNGAVTVPLTQGEFDALVTWTFNLGCGTLRKSKVLAYLNASDYDTACEHMKLYDKAGGETLPGLTRRRLAEADLFEATNA